MELRDDTADISSIVARDLSIEKSHVACNVAKSPVKGPSVDVKMRVA